MKKYIAACLLLALVAGTTYAQYSPDTKKAEKKARKNGNEEEQGQNKKRR